MPTSSKNRGFIELATGKLVPGSAPATGLFVQGTINEGRFSPEGDVQGSGSMGDAGKQGWMELADGSFHGQQTARPPFPPYVQGFQISSGEFRPSTRKVVY